jgi:FkbM family methyltransferase
MTTKRFKDWAGEDAMSYIIETAGSCYNQIERKIKKGELGEKVKLIKGAAWSENADLYLSELNQCSRVTEQEERRMSEKGEKIKGIKIDDVIPEATFIKMDIEGVEVEAIRGAAELIKKCKPRMAISIYHKPTDVLAVPAEILKINPEYKFIIRHYSTWEYETVLYAYI